MQPNESRDPANPPDSGDRDRAVPHLGAGEDLLRSLFSSMDQGFCVIEVLFDDTSRPIDYRFLEVNPAFESHTGLRDAAGKTAKALVPDLEDSWFEAYGRVALTGESERFENGAESMDGRWFSVSAFRVGQPESHRVAVLFSDVTDRRHVEAQLRASEARHRTILESITDGFFALDSGWKFTYVNPQFEEILGQSGHEVLGKTLWDVYPGLDDSDIGQIYRRVAANRAAESATGYYPGHHRWYEFHAYPAVDGLSIYFRDVTQRVVAEDALRASERKFREFADSAPAILWVTDADGNCTFLSRGWYDFTGQGEGEALGVGWHNAVHPDDQARSRAIFSESNARQETYECEYRVRRSDGEYRWALDIGHARFSEDGAYRGYVGSVIDVHDRKLAEEEKSRLDDRVRLALDSARLGTWNIKPARKELITDERFREIFGIVGDHCGYQQAVDILHPDDRDRVAEAIAESTRLIDPLPYSLEYRVVHPDGSIRWVFANGRSNFTGEGAERRLASFDGTVADITDQKNAEAELQTAEQQKQTILESITEGFVAVDSEWRFMYLNAEAERIYAAKRDDLLGKTLWEVFPQAIGTIFEREYRRSMLDRTPARVDAVFEHLQVWFEVNVFPVQDGGLSFYFRDVTQRRKDETAIREGEQRHRLIMANVKDHAIFMLDLDGLVSDWNVGAEQVFGHGQEIIGQSAAILFTPEDQAQNRAGQEMEQARIQGRASDNRWHLKRDGSRFYARGSLEALRAADGELRGFVKVVKDQTAEKQAEDARERRARQLQQLTDIATRVNSAHDVDSVVRVVTEEARHLIGAKQAATSMMLNRLQPHPLNVVSMATMDLQIPLTKLIDVQDLRDAVNAGNRPVRLAQNELAHDPRWRLLEKVALVKPTGNGWLAAPLVGRDGESLGLLQLADKLDGEFTADDEAILVQLSRLAAIAIENARLYQELRSDDERKDEFLAMLAHELRNPLSAIGNAVKLSSTSGEKEQIDWSMEVITRQMQHLSRLIDDLMDVSRITRGKIELRRDVMDVTTILDSAAETVRPLADERKHTFEIQIDRGNLWAHVDPTRLEQVVINLLSNAAKYSENSGNIRLTARVVGSEVVIRVKDRGVGIPPDKLPAMFELFAQGDRSLARSEGGLGIGLTLVKKLVEMHGGRIEAHSDGPGTGSEFTVRLPSARKPSHVITATERRAGPVKKARILVVDDNVDTARGMARLLKMIGHDVATAHNGVDAIETAKGYRPEFVLLDIGLPGMSGYEVAAQLRREESCRDCVIVAISGYGQDEDRRRSKAAGFDLHLVKPLDHDALLAVLAR